MPEDVRVLKKYFTFLKKEREFWDNGVWQDLVDNLVPEWEDLARTKTKGKRKAQLIYDSSPRDYLNVFSDGMHGNIINQSIVWFENRLPRRFKFLEEEPAVRRYLQEKGEQLYFTFGNSNFYSQMRSYFKAGGGIGTATLFIEEDKALGRLTFPNLHPRECYIAENKHGEVDVCFRLFKVTARVIKQMFGIENLSPAVLQALKNNPFNEFEIIHAVYPNGEFNGSSLNAKNKRFASKWFQNITDVKVKFLRESGFDMFPFHVWRYARNENGPYGDSPGTLALPEIMGLQQIGKSLLRFGNQAADPAWNVPAEMKGKVRVNPHGMNYYGPDFNRKITAVHQGGDFPVALDREDKKDGILKRHFFVDFFKLLEQRERAMTAREVAELTGEKALILAAGIGDLNIVLDGVIDHVDLIETRGGRMPTPPDILLDFLGGSRIPIEYMGPLAMAQKRLFQTRGITDSLQIAAPFVEQFPETADLINKDETLKDILVAYGFPQANILPTDIVGQIREGRAQAQQDEKRKIDMERLAEVLKDLGMADKQSQGKFTRQIAEILGGGQPGALPVAA